MSKPTQPRSLLRRTVGLATLVCVGVAETACNLQVSPAREDAAPRVDGGTSDAAVTDAADRDASGP